jgi:conjugal transfer pilus assembly protein TraV
MAACGNLSGLDGTDRYACNAPQGVKCESVSGTYQNAITNNLPSQRLRHNAAARTADPTSPAVRRESAADTMRVRLPGLASAPGPSDLAPLRSQPKVLRLWVKPWEDTDRDLHDQSYVYVQIDSGQWLVERAQRQIRDAYAPVRPPHVSQAHARTATPTTAAEATPAAQAASALPMILPARPSATAAPVQE